MGSLESRIEGATGEVVSRLEAGEAPGPLAKSLGLGPIDVVAAIARVGLGAEGSDGPGLVQASSTHPVLVKALTDDALAGLFPEFSRPTRLALAAGLLQILDSWEASHTAAQEADDLGERSTAAYWHMIAHRREPDAGNALYWARQVGRHPIFEPLAEAAQPLLEAYGDRALADRLAPAGVWAPTAMIDLTTRAKAGPPFATLARRLQRLEMIYLLSIALG